MLKELGSRILMIIVAVIGKIIAQAKILVIIADDPQLCDFTRVMLNIMLALIIVYQVLIIISDAYCLWHGIE